MHVDRDVFDLNDPSMTPLNVWSGSAMVTGTPPTTELILPTLTQFHVLAGIQDKAWSKWSFPDTKEAGAQVCDP
ncbi:MAG TPA: hypothetical protein VK843_16245 [Planctomycetota bacterium]|nr:hypothetical protein [Planctomycetota bacterium]